MQLGLQVFTSNSAAFDLQPGLQVGLHACPGICHVPDSAAAHLRFAIFNSYSLSTSLNPSIPPTPLITMLGTLYGCR